MAQPSYAWYKIIIPVNDNLGNRLVDLSTAAFQQMFKQSKGAIEGAHTTRGTTGHWRDDPNEPMDLLELLLPDTPENDSQIKHTALYVAECGNQWAVACMKTGQKGPSPPWLMNNEKYREGEPAEPSMIASPVRQSAFVTPCRYPSALANIDYNTSRKS